MYYVRSLAIATPWAHTRDFALARSLASRSAVALRRRQVEGEREERLAKSPSDFCGLRGPFSF